MSEFSESEVERLNKAAGLLFEAEDRLPVLKSTGWTRDVADRFFADGEKELPRPVYAKIDPAPSTERVAEARKLIDGSSSVHDWLRRLCDVTDQTASMLGAMGTAEFYTHSTALYGSPTTPIADGNNTALDLANRLDTLLSDFDEGTLRLEAPVRLSAEELKAELEAELPQHFGEDTPEVIVTSEVNAKAAAGRDYIKLREDARFTDLDVTQLLQHEALIHIATGFNGSRHGRFEILGESHPGNARTQEGLAVFAEFITGAIDPRRFRRLADRTIAIDMSANGADFLEIYNFFREKATRDAPFEAFESARRVVRGGLVEGGAPLTKDGVYLSGLVEVHSYLRAAIRAGDLALIHLLFVGKVDLEDLDAMDLLMREGLIKQPQFMPQWAKDARYLLANLSYSTFHYEIDLAQVAERYDSLLSRYKNL
ncbi:flavohemoglobin expression-modulating QEGLA motif protein [Ponticaulis sp.]|uniref:flavohemoglobin expression-modulating QEGLA motif protein n=1 Tax=Ponticaulis sp. TaxID=2020902 RepID=UPI000B64F825|nr:flavohemoglobin expression-modulating QEGLA motif protein [Ponticaulis sp.]MAI89093.1 hypothetical protein [Ponticaulis sp.]OUY01376.1 MAG: hypothetical protein CBB65_01245 [Hyphomonadaceae bacterium TMED5]|tara:strand:+ start:9954 stop:11231 length:1278 start_codon:yes stop_codon:yes gene_type:complete